MKKFIFILAAMLVFPAAAQAEEARIESTTYETEEECNVALSYERTKDSSCSFGECRFLTANQYRFTSCTAAGNDCTFPSRGHCLRSTTGHATCAQDPSTGCYYPTSCNNGYYEIRGYGLSGVTVSYQGCSDCPENATCDGKNVFCDSGYTLTVKDSFWNSKICVSSTTENDKTDDIKQTEAVASIEGECPDGLRKSSDGCCCLK